MAYGWENLTQEVRYPTRDSTSDVALFLAHNGLGYDPHPDVIVVFRDTSGAIIATGSLAGRVIKHLAVAAEWQGSGVALRLFDQLYRLARLSGFDRVLAFTSLKTSPLLVSLGFEMIACTQEAALLEFGSSWDGGGFDNYLAALPKHPGAGAIVMNANPFTLGHLHLVETAARECNHVVIFMVSEDRSTFPTPVRVQLIREGVQALPNVSVVEGGDYIISQATFPRYFLREPGRAAEIQARLDATLFATRIAPAVLATTRYVGEEPFDRTTEIYNEAMKEVFAKSSVSLKVIPRIRSGDRAISASSVREALRAGDWGKLSQLVPQTTMDFLRSKEAMPIIEKIRAGVTPH